MNMNKVEERDDQNVIQIKYENIIIFSLGLKIKFYICIKVLIIYGY